LAAAAEAVICPGSLAVVVPEMLKMVVNSRVIASGVLSGYCMRDKPFARLVPHAVSLVTCTGRFGGKPPLTLQAHPRQDGDSPREACRTDADRTSLGGLGSD